jgi:glycosyltransferase involved in cell wall biosynthesis
MSHTVPNTTAPVTTKSIRKLSILHVIHSVCHGGIESALINWVRFFDRSEVNVHVACFTGDRGREKAFYDSAARAGITVLPIQWTKYKPFLKAARAVADLVRELDIDVVHTHAYYADVVGSLTKMFVPVKVVATVYVWGKYEFHRQLMQVMDWTALHFVDKVTAHCDDTYEKTIRLGFRRNRVEKLIAGFPAHEITQAVPEERLRLRHSKGVADDEILMLNIARIHPEKAHDQLLQSFKIVHDKHANTKLWIAGVGWRELEEQLLKLRDELGLSDSVEFIGFHGDLTPFLDMADIMTHPSHVEGVPIAILLGMSAGLPIVISDVGSVREVIRPGHTGLLADENDFSGFADQVTNLIEDREFARRLGRGALEFVSTEYSIHTAVSRVVNTYKEVTRQ